MGILILRYLSRVQKSVESSFITIISRSVDNVIEFSFQLNEYAAAVGSI